MPTKAPTPHYASLEVWLGPMEGLSLLGEAGSGKVIRMGRVGDKGRGKENHLVLSRGVGVSASHAELRLEDGHLFLKDLGSTNGTFAQGRRITTEVELPPGEVFLVSFTPIRVELAEEPGTATLPLETNVQSRWREPLLQGVLGAARGAAEARHETFIDSRHLCDAVLRSGSAPVQAQLAEAGWSCEAALAELWSGGLFRGPNQWFAEVLNRPVELRLGGESQMLLAPKVVRWLETALRRATTLQARPSDGVLERALLGVMLQDAGGAVGGWLLRHGLVARAADVSGEIKRPATVPPSGARPSEQLAPPDAATIRELIVPPATAASRAPVMLATERVRLTPESAPPRAAPPAAPVVPASAAVPVPAPQQPPQPTLRPAPPPEAPSAEPALDEVARDLSRDLMETAASLRFATSGERREALKARILRALRNLTPERRARLVEQVRQQFPVSGPVRLEDEAPPRRDTRDRAAGRAPEIPWAELLGPRSKTKPADQQVLSVRELFHFAVEMEGFVLNLAQAATLGRGDARDFRLPGHADTLQGYLVRVRDGKCDAAELAHYLAALRRWQTALLLAHQEAPRLWFARLWKRINPLAIEAQPRAAGWKLRGETAEWWESYQRAVAGLTPDQVQDQVLQVAAQLARDELEKPRSTETRRTTGEG